MDAIFDMVKTVHCLQTICFSFQMLLTEKVNKDHIFRRMKAKGSMKIEITLPGKNQQQM
jgi:hypothetical protein